MTEVDTVSHRPPLGGGLKGWGQRAYGLVFLVQGLGEIELLWRLCS